MLMLVFLDVDLKPLGKRGEALKITYACFLLYNLCGKENEKPHN